jgi:hypothetical protein
MEIAPLMGVVLFSDEERGAEFYREHFAPALNRLTAGLTRFQENHDRGDYTPRLVIELAMGAAMLLSLDKRFGDRAGVPNSELAEQLADHIRRITEAP